jgi:hypothetical protein
MKMDHHTNITIQPVIGGFIVQYPVRDGLAGFKYVTEVVTTVGKAMRVAKKAVEEFSLVAKTKDEVEA